MKDPDELKVDPGAPPAPGGPALEPRPSRHRIRRITTWFLIVLFAILTPITVTAGWAVRTLTDTNRYVATMQPLITDPVVQNYVATKATNTLFEQVNVQRKITDALPSSSSFLAAPITAQLKQFTNKEMLRLVSSKWFAQLWERENRFTHSAAIAVLTGKPSPQVSNTRQLIIDITPTLVQAIDNLDKQGITIFNPLKDHLQNNKSLSLQLFNSKQVKTVQSFFHLAILLRVILLVGTPLVGLAAIAFSVRRRRTAFRVMVAGAIGAITLSVGLTAAKAFFVAQAPTLGQLFAAQIFAIMTRYLTASLHWVIVAFVVGAVFFWIIGDTAWAMTLRKSLVGGSKQLSQTADQIRRSEKTAQVLAEGKKAARYIGRTVVPFRWGGAILAAILVVRANTTGSVLWILVDLALYQVALSLLERWAKASDLANTATADDTSSAEKLASPS